MCDCGGKNSGRQMAPIYSILVIAAGLVAANAPLPLSARRPRHSAIIFVATIASIVRKRLLAVAGYWYHRLLRRLCCRRQTSQRRDYHGAGAS